MQERSSPNLPKLTRNEQLVLKKIIQYSRIPDSRIAKTMRISQQAVFKIRHKLEQSGIIRGYEPIIDFKKIGITALIVIGVRFSAHVWEKYSEEKIAENLLKNPHIIAAYRIVDSEISHMILMAFEDSARKYEYIKTLQTKYSRELSIIRFYPFPIDGLIKLSNIGLLSQVLDKKHFPVNESFLPDK